ncbi:right-handed parallel beta-helix repeat-containing protein [Myxococcota bacterium]|nr:right-handed parallel beta-helix repeat-containing protein [Myxococcota bacterium]MBU1533773.1 right-handed parallel beta-helix repeat-containing protein [Myxococcota bacterium]
MFRYGITKYSLFFLLFLLSACDDGSGAKKYPVPDVDIQLPPVTCDDIDLTGGFHVTVAGTPEGDGSLSNPWDLDTALRHPAAVLPGDTIWVHGGTYVGAWVAKLDGVEDAPIVVSAWPGDRVTLDSAGSEDPVLQIYHQWAVFRGLELTNSDPDRRNSRGTGIWAGGDHISLQNLVVHEVGSGISGGQLDNDVQQGNFVELHGCIFYNNGWLGTDRGHGHHIYLTNRDSKMMLVDNLIFSAYGSGVHAYSETDRNYVQGFDFIGNVWFLNGAPGRKLVDGCLVGHNGSHGVDAIVLRENFGWAAGLDGRDVRMGWSAPHNGGAILEDNYLVGLTVFLDEWDSVELTGNTIIGSLEGLSAEDYPDNTYSAIPDTTRIFIRRNRYEPGRAHIIVYNWEESPTVSVDLESIIPAGTPFEIRNAEDFYGLPVATGTYEGAQVVLPMDLTAAPPLGEPDAIPQSTGLQFKTFVLLADPCGIL